MVAEIPNLVHLVRGAAQDAHFDMLHRVHAFRADLASRMHPLTKLAEAVLNPVNTHLHGALAKIHHPAITVRPVHAWSCVQLM
jgi:hypothetical protein